MKNAIKAVVEFMLAEKQMIQISTKDPYFNFVMGLVQDKVYIVPVRVNYTAFIEDSLMSKHEFREIRD